MKIQNKLILSCGLQIAILLGEIIVNQIITYRAKKTFLELKEDIGPTVKLLDDYNSANRELSLLNNSWIIGYNKRATNKINAILDVEFPYFKAEISTQGEGLKANDTRLSLINVIIEHTEELIDINKELVNLLVTSEDYRDEEKLERARKMMSEKVSPLHFLLDDTFHRLQLLYNKQFERSQNKLLENLEAVSLFILIIGGFGILIGLLVSRQVIKSILHSILNLSNLARKVSSGKFGMQTELRGNDELTTLAASLNSMSLRLKEIFLKNEERIDELEEFAYIATHDLKVPIDNIKGFHNALMKKVDLEDDRVRAIMNWIENSIVQANKIIADLARVTQSGNQEFDEEDLRFENIFKEVCEFLENKIKDSDAEIEVDFDYSSIKYSKRQLTSIFQNLLDNAIKYRSPERRLKINVSSKIEGDFAVISFKDNGLGINLNTQREKLFGLFKRISTDAEGSGIGLYMIKKLIEKAGGKIEVESEENVGSTFIVYLKDKSRV